MKAVALILINDAAAKFLVQTRLETPLGLRIDLTHLLGEMRCDAYCKTIIVSTHKLSCRAKDFDERCRRFGQISGQSDDFIPVLRSNVTFALTLFQLGHSHVRHQIALIQSKRLF